MKQNVGISIIIPNYNSGIFLLETVESVLKQKISLEYEIIIIDDKSTDSLTLKTLELISNIDGVVIVKNQKNIGVQASRNKGLLLSKYTMILSIDSDDKLLSYEEEDKESYINKSINVLIENKDIAFIHTLSMMFGDFKGLTISSYPLSEEKVIKKHHVPISIIYRKEDILNTKMYSRNILKWQDWAFAINILAQRWRLGKKNDIYFIKGPCYGYRIHSYNNRISRKKVSENKMTLLVVKDNLDYFNYFFKENKNPHELSNKLIKLKPTRLIDLLYVSQYDFRLAIEIIDSRDGELRSIYHDLGIP